MFQDDLYSYYTSLFEGIVADTDALRQESFRIRHQVYCFEMKTECANVTGLESDRYDADAIHGLLRYRPTGHFIGTVRLVPHRTADYAATTPVLQLCRSNGLRLPSDYLPEDTAEISRFAISKLFYRRALSARYADAVTAEERDREQARTMPWTALGLMMLVNKMALLRDVDRYCAVMEPALIRLLAHLGMNFQPVGPLIEHHGQRQICHATMHDMHRTITQKQPEVFKIVTEGKVGVAAGSARRRV